jgi:hypothetical protein
MLRFALPAVLIAACAGDSEPRNEPSRAPPADVVADPEPEPRPAARLDPEPSPPPPAPTVAPTPARPRLAPPAIAIDRVETRRVSVNRAEDGAGNQIAPPAGGAVAVDLKMEKIPGRALDPVLEIGGATFRRYQILADGTLRFIVARPDLAEAGEVVLRWGRDTAVVASQLKVSP